MGNYTLNAINYAQYVGMYFPSEYNETNCAQDYMWTWYNQNIVYKDVPNWWVFNANPEILYPENVTDN